MKILVIEDHHLIRDMLMMACGNVAPGAEVRGASTATEGLATVRDFQPDLIFLDLVLPDGDGLESMPAITKACPSAKVIALTSHTDEFTLHRALRSEVHGFVDKNEQPLGVLKEAITTVMAGHRYYSSAAQRLHQAMRKDPAEFNKVLSDREQELLSLFGLGLNNDEIAAKVGLTAGTVKIHRVNIMNKLDVHSTPQLIHYALEKGFTRIRRPAAPVKG